MKYGEVTLGEVEAAINNLGGKKVWDAWLRGEKTVTVTDAVRLLFDKHGRRIPEGLSANVCDGDRKFRLVQPELKAEVDYLKRLSRLHECLGSFTAITAGQFRAETERLLALIRNNPQIANIIKGVGLPVVIPPLTTKNPGVILKQYLEAVGKSYIRTFGDREFRNLHKNTSANEFSIVEGSRHDQLIERMKWGPVIGIHFPAPLQGFSINADREQVSTLPEGFILSGMDTPIAMVMYPDILARDRNTLCLNMAALSAQSAECTPAFVAHNEYLVFSNDSDPTSALCFNSGGLLFLGPVN
ncbi:MAG: hypothetical protein PHD51_00110 [Patescibacteria group bacterium]|nr:hypothetical protein [Patescibacteria group bacterium]MDD5490728.1 hypothetical protein [Patescibacteria group bacterium]